MNYYPNNFYGNYSYNQNFLSNNLLGKIVDGEDVVKATDVPFGGCGVFPKADFSEVYIKTWNNDGTTRVMKYKPVEPVKEVVVDTDAILLEKLSYIENAISQFMNIPVANAKQDAVAAPEKQSTTVETRKDVNFNGF